MDTHENQLIQAPPQQEFKLQPAAIDWSTNKTQVTAAAFVALAGAGALHLLGVHSGAVLGTTSAALLAARVLSSVLVALITAELTGPQGNRLGATPAIWAAVLFAFSPNAGADAGTWTQAGCVPLYLLAVFSFLRYRNTKEPMLLRWALAACALALCTRREASTIPGAILAAEVLLPKERSGQTWMAVVLFFLVLCFVGTIGILLPQMVPFMDHYSLPQAYNDANLRAIFLSVSPVAQVGYILTALCAVAGCAGHITLFLFVWTLLSSTDASLMVAPLSILLATAAIPMRAVTKKAAKAVAITGSIALTLIAYGWITR